MRRYSLFAVRMGKHFSQQMKRFLFYFVDGRWSMLKMELNMLPHLI